MTPPSIGSITFTLNGAVTTCDVEPAMPLLWALRDVCGATGTRFGCGMALCGACTVHLNGTPVRSCSTPMSAVAGQQVTTIEGVTGPAIEALRAAWTTHDVPQCGYCQSGQLMSACALLTRTATPSPAEIDAAMEGNLCRCGTYPRIRTAIADAAQTLATGTALRAPASPTSSPS
jgi:isoquinoline 1-oxidoreductase alpha subunit